MSPSRWSTTQAALLELGGDDVRRSSTCRQPESPVNQTTRPVSAQLLHVFRATCACRTRSCRSRPSGPRALAGLRRVRVADRRVALVVQRVVREAAFADVGPAVLVAPVGERVRLPELVLLVPAELRRVRARRRLVAADAGDPGVEVAERAHQRLDLRDREVEVGVRLPDVLAVRRSELVGRRPLEDLDRRPVPLLDLAPVRVGLREQVVRVDARRRAPSARARTACRGEPSPPSGTSTRARPCPGTARAATRGSARRIDSTSVRQLCWRQGAPPSVCRRGARGAASRAGSPRRAGCSRG